MTPPSTLAVCCCFLASSSASAFQSAPTKSHFAAPPLRGPVLKMSTLNSIDKEKLKLKLKEPLLSDIPYFAQPADWTDVTDGRLVLETASMDYSLNADEDDSTATVTVTAAVAEEEAMPSLPPLMQGLMDKVGKIDESRIVSTREYRDGEVPQLFSNLEYRTTQQPNSHGNGTTTKLSAHQSSTNSFLSSSALLTGTALGSGLLTLPTAISPVLTAASSASGDVIYTYGPGFLPSLPATLIAWAYMTISALLTSELLINRIGDTGRVRNVGLLELYETYLGKVPGRVAGVGFLLLNYIMMGVYLSEGGDRLSELILQSSSSMSNLGGMGAMDGNGLPLLLSRALFATVMGTFLSTASKYNVVQRTMTHFFVPATILAFMASITMAFPTADLHALVDLSNQHPEVVLNAFPLLFMSWTYHGVVPRVVYDLEGDKDKITKAIVGGSSTALVMYLVWNAVIIGNVLGDGASATTFAGGNPLLGLQGSQYLQSSITIVSELAVVTSLIGVVLGFVNEFYDAIGAMSLPSYGPKEDNKWKAALLTLLPSAVVSVALGYYGDGAVDNVAIIDYAGAFGASTLFLILPALMAWQCRYGDDARPLTVKPMVPFGKIALGSLYKAAGTLIVEQGLEKLGVFEFVQHLFNSER